MNHHVGLVDQIRVKLLGGAFILSSSRIQIQLCCVVDVDPLLLENFRSEFDLLAVGAKEVSESEFCQTCGEACLGFVISELIAVVEFHLQKFRG